MAKKNKIISIEETLLDSANKPESSSWSYLKGNAKQPDIALKIDNALFTVEKSKPIISSYVYS